MNVISDLKLKQEITTLIAQGVTSTKEIITKIETKLNISLANHKEKILKFAQEENEEEGNEEVQEKKDKEEEKEEEEEEKEEEEPKKPNKEKKPTEKKKNSEDEEEEEPKKEKVNTKKRKNEDSDSESKPKKEKIENSGKKDPFLKDDQGGFYIDLTSKKRITISEFRGKTYVGIREFYEKDGKKLPSQKGISLNIEEWKFFQEFIPKINEKFNK